MRSSRVIVTPRVVPVHFTPIITAGVRGRIVVKKYDRDGERAPVRVDRSRRAFQRVWEHQQPNLITNAGMDFAASMGVASVGGATGFGWSALANYVAVGTSSAAPQFTDTSLGNEIARTTATLGLGPSMAASHPSEGRQLIERTRVFDFGEANGNLTEFGGFRLDDESDPEDPEDPPTGTALFRELFRDESSNPVPITKTSNEQLAIHHFVELQYSPTERTAAPDISVAGYGTFSASLMFHRAWGGTTFFIARQSGLDFVPVTALTDTYDTSDLPSLPSGVPTGGSGFGVWQAYAGGTYHRDCEFAHLGTASDQTLAGLLFRSYGATSQQNFLIASFRFVNPASLLKDKDYRLTCKARLAFARV